MSLQLLVLKKKLFVKFQVFVLNKIEDLNLSVFNIMTGINESKTLIKHISFECKCKFHGRKCYSDQWWKNDRCWYECKKGQLCKKNYFWNPATCSCVNGKYLPSTIDDSAITCDEIIGSYDKEAKNIPKNFNEKKKTVKFKIYMFYLHFY